jgi:hypothetical protein
VRNKQIVKIRRASGYEKTWLLQAITLFIDEDMKKHDILELCSLDGNYGTTAWREEVIKYVDLEEPLNYDWMEEWETNRMDLALRALGR